jgi:hypothetical protein
MRSGRAKALVWATALAIPVIVAVSRMYRGMHHPLDTVAGVFIGIAASSWPCCSFVWSESWTAGEGRAPHEHRRGTSRIPGRLSEAVARAQARARAARCLPSRCGTRCRRAARRRSEFVRRSTHGADLIFVWAGTGWCNGASTRSTATRHARDRARRNGEPLRHESRDPEGHRAGCSHRLCTGRAGCSTSGA